MKLFACQACGQLLYFENVRCEHCGRTLGYLPDLGTHVVLGAQIRRRLDGAGGAGKGLQILRQCALRRVQLDAAGDGGPDGYCAACRHNHVIPDLSVPGNDALWARMEAAKHRLFYTLINLRLPLANRDRRSRSMAWRSIFSPIRRRRMPPMS